ncbi:unnamed protein product [Anisakis simplex]|uniref:40S ribosomal protein S30 n=1 Tax=Anisakis simplex TaxID=6269 RepID=A0A0M3JTJ5_ANISI|nr:unnamed protein product [Anisakis simplex]
MLAAARGVSLGLGKINLADLRLLPKERLEPGKVKRSPTKVKKTKTVIKKHVDKKVRFVSFQVSSDNLPKTTS